MNTLNSDTAGREEDLVQRDLIEKFHVFWYPNHFHILLKHIM